MDKSEDLVVSAVMWPHDDGRANLQQSFFDVKDEVVQLGPNCSQDERGSEPVNAELLVRPVGQWAPIQVRPLLAVASMDFHDTARL